MQTRLAAAIAATASGREAEAILRTCVHCGFCLPTCPTYQILGDELDSPRGRIYLIKQMLEGAAVTQKTLTHLDRCLTCRNCETTCPSGVQYGRLIDIGRAMAEEKVSRSPLERIKRAALNGVLTNGTRFDAMLALGRIAKPLLPQTLARKIPDQPEAGSHFAGRNTLRRKMLALQGCVQPSLAPQINAAAARVLETLGIALISADQAGCCGAVSFHLNYQDQGRAYMRRNIDAWWPYVEAEAEAIVMTASGCGLTVKEYAHHLKDDPSHAAKAARISALTRDICEVVLSEQIRLLDCLRQRPSPHPVRVAWHSPCTLQHGQKITGIVEALLTAAGYDVLVPVESNLCCGSAGTYSLLEPDIAGQLRDRKLVHLQGLRPDVIATANIGCLAHLQSGTDLPVHHWIELLDAALVSG
ncbi:MAG TPA: glycolate oxidase subunit GlcF [Thiobacillaceae bacterium]|nr:glycolate oxidase subunit GlcF [Thiobacillaceae bacterium]